MSEVMDLVVIEKQNAMAVFTTKEQLDPLIEKIEKEARSLVADVSTKKGRDAIASMAHKVARSKTYIDNAGKDLVTELKALPKQIDESRRIVRERLDALKDEVRRPLTEWEAEQERIRQEEEARIAAEALAKQVEADHEIALLMDREFDRQREEARLKAEQEQREREEKLKREAAEAARLEAEQKARAEREAAARRELELKMKAEQEERARIEAEQRAEREKKEAAERAEREKQAAIAEEKRKAQEEADRIRREAESRESARIAEQQRIAAEEAARAADVEHRRTINRRVISQLAEQGVPEEFANAALVAIASGKIQDAIIRY